LSLGERFGEVLAAAQAGAPWALEAIYRDLYAPVLSFLTARAGDEGEDLTSEVFITVAERLRTFDGDERGLRSWVFTIAYRKAGEWWRQARRRRTTPAAPRTW